MKYFRFCIIVLFTLSFFSVHNGFVFALTVDELKAQIEAKQRDKTKLEAEKAKLEAQITETGKQTQTLQTAVKVLDTTSKKLSNDIAVTQNNIGSTELVIEKTTIDINFTESQIEQNKQAIGEALRSMRESNEKTFIEALLQYENINELWGSIENLEQFQSSLKRSSDELRGLKTDLESQKHEKELKKKELLSLKGDLVDQNTIVAQNKNAKTSLLTQTKSKEVEYKRMLAANIELGKKFEQELFQFESELKVKIDTSKLPSRSSGALGFPLAKVLITQRFGKTADSGRLYVSGTHNGVDFGTSVGTPTLSVGDGVVSGTGNTDDQAGCYSYGRWVLIKHTNGLSSLYSHLSASKVALGHQVTRGQVIGFSGGQPGASGAGYSTGPHLHLGLFATEGVSVQKYTNSMFCKQVSIPIAAVNAYLDPLAYLPPLN